MMDFLEEFGIPLFLCALLMGILLCGIFGFITFLSSIECKNLTEVTKRKTTFRWVGGCYVEHEGEMLPYERWKLLDVRVTERK